tara:strand:- start:664 stop:894 length:231 start_codon:yes stop_codon:yes gene_type:complete
MKFKQYDDGSCDIIFSEEEKKIINQDGKIHLTEIFLRHFGNVLMKIVADWQLKFKEENKKIFTKITTRIEGKKSPK